MPVKLITDGKTIEYPSFIPKTPPKLRTNAPANNLLKSLHKKREKLGSETRPLTEEEMDGILIAEGLPFHRENRGAVGKRATQVQIEYRQKQVQRLLARGVPPSIMAVYLGVSVAKVYVDIQQIEQRIRMGVSNLDFPLFVGQALAFFDEARQMALRTATSIGIKTSDKNFALSVAIQAETAKQKYMQMVGLYKNPAPVVPIEEEKSDATDFQTFMDLVTGDRKTLDSA